MSSKVQLIKICIIDPLQVLGGQEKVVFDLLNGLDPKLFNIHFCTSTNNNFNKYSIPDYVKIKYISMEKRLSIISLYQFYRYFKKNNFDLINPHGNRAGLISRIAAILSRNKIIWTMHVLTSDFASRYNYIKKNIYLIIDKILNHFTDKIITVANATKKGLIESENIHPKKISVVYNGIREDFILNKYSDIKKELKINKNKIIIGTISILKEQKGIHVLIDGYKRLIEILKEDSVHLLIVGDGPEREKLRNMVSDYNLDDKVTFAGYQSEVYNYLNIIDIFVLPSYYEGFPIALLESMLSGKITIATNVNGVPELIEDNINGFLFNPGDVAKLKIILHNIITDYPRYKYISSNAKLRVEENFLMSNFINDIQKIYIEEACKN